MFERAVEHMIELIVLFPIQSGIIGLCIAVVYFAIVFYLERHWVTMLKVGDRVVHDYSKHKGKVIAKRRNKEGYNYQVKFHMPENEGGEEYRIDWYKREFLKQA